jgi:hypothetical protein
MTNARCGRATCQADVWLGVVACSCRMFAGDGCGDGYVPGYGTGAGQGRGVVQDWISIESWWRHRATQWLNTEHHYGAGGRSQCAFLRLPMPLRL